MKDWSGNKNSIFKTLGASNHTKNERQSEDYYATDPIAIDKLVSVMALPKTIWECSCGAGHLSERLQDLGYNVISTDLVDRGYGKAGVDFLATKEMPSESNGNSDVAILTNPPYKISTDFIEHALQLLPTNGYAIFLLKTTALEGKGRYTRLFKENPPRYVLQFIERLLCAKNGDFLGMKQGGGSAVAYAWFVWQKGYKGNCIVKWI